MSNDSSASGWGSKLAGWAKKAAQKTRDELEREKQRVAERAEQAKQAAELEAAKRRAAEESAKSALARPAAKDDDGEGFVEAEWGVPHCRFERTPEGFKVQFNRTGLGIHKTLSSANQTSRNGLSGAFGSLVVLAGTAVVAGAQKAGGGTTIEVTRNAVIVDGKKMRRREFGGFNVAKTWKAADREDTLAVLGYRHGIRSFEFGGAWNEVEAAEVASALNTHLRDTPMEGDEERASPDQLRAAARPSEF